MQKTNIKSIGQVLVSLFNKNSNLADKLAETRILNFWNYHSHPMIMNYTQNLFIKNRILYVSINSSELKNELIMRREALILWVNKEARKKMIDWIIFN